MAKETMLTYLDAQLSKNLTDYEVAIDWDSKNHTIELIIRLWAENKDQLLLDDFAGIESEEEVIEFEDGILLYDPKKSQFDPDDYLATLAFEGKKGMKAEQLAGLVDYLKEVLDDGQSDLLDFLDLDNEEAVFELHFDQKRLEEYILKNANPRYIPYPSY